MRWKTIWESPRYEISSEGVIRVKRDFPNEGYVPRQYVAMAHGHPGSLCVDLYYDNKKKARRVWLLMQRYWPDVECPPEWRATRNLGPTDRNPTKDRRIKLNMKQYREIIASPLPSTRLAELYPVSSRYIRKLKRKNTDD